MFENGEFALRKNVIVATDDLSQTDPHFYTSEGKTLPSVSTVLSHYSEIAVYEAYKMSMIPEWVSQVGNYAHAMAESHAATKAGMDHSRFPLPDLSNFATKTQSSEALFMKGSMAGNALIAGLVQLEFRAKAIEERFIDLERGFSGTIDLIGFIAGIPTVIDLKAQGNASFGKESDRYLMQVGAYASMFQDYPQILKVLAANRENGKWTEFSYTGDQIIEAITKWESALQQFNERLSKGLVHIPELIANGGISSSTAADTRLMDMWNTKIPISDPAGGTGPYIRQGITTTTPKHTSSLGKIFPPFNIKGEKNPAWDKHPDRLNVFEARLENLYRWAANEPDSVNPTIREIIASLKSEGVEYNELLHLLHAPKGSIADNHVLIKTLRRFYDSLKPIAFKLKILDGQSADILHWEDARTLLNVFEEAGKSFVSMPDFTLCGKNQLGDD